MVQAYVALDDVDNAVAAQEIVADDRNSGRRSTRRWRMLAWQAGQTRKGDLASTRRSS